MKRRRRDGSDENLRLAPGLDTHDIARRMERDYGCEGITMDARRGKVLGLRYRGDVATTHKEIDVEKFKQNSRARGPRIYSIPSRKGRK